MWAIYSMKHPFFEQYKIQDDRYWLVEFNNIIIEINLFSIFILIIRKKTKVITFFGQYYRYVEEVFTCACHEGLVC